MTYERFRNRCLIGAMMGLFLVGVAGVGSVSAESPSPTVHWGGLAYPDQSRVLDVGYTGNRFTEFDGQGRRFNNMDETMGLNFATVSWTEHWKSWQGFSTNLTVGAGPTGEQPTRYLQNEFIHDAVWGIPKVPVGTTRDGADFMIDGSLTGWGGFWGQDRLLFAGGGFSTGSLYHEAFVRAGMRRLNIGDPIAAGSQALVRFVTAGSVPRLLALDWLKGFRLSAMGRYGRSWSGSAFKDVAPQTYFGQGSVSWGIYDNDHAPFVEVELGAAIDSGLFTSLRGDALEGQFWTVKVQVRRFVVETWNDQLNRQDYGPTYGLRLTYDLSSLLWEKGP